MYTHPVPLSIPPVTADMRSTNPARSDVLDEVPQRISPCCAVAVDCGIGKDNGVVLSRRSGNSAAGVGSACSSA